MNKLSLILKEIEREERSIIPSIEVAKELAEKANMGDEVAFKELFKICRFAPTPRSKKEKEALSIVVDGFVKSRYLFL